MNRITVVLSAVSLATLMPTAPAAADTPDTAHLGIIDFCKVDVPTNHPDMPLGSCISFQSTNFRDNVDGLIPHLCSYLEAVHPDLFYTYYDSFTDCVTDRASVFLG